MGEGYDIHSHSRDHLAEDGAFPVPKGNRFIVLKIPISYKTLERLDKERELWGVNFGMGDLAGFIAWKIGAKTFPPPPPLPERGVER